MSEVEIAKERALKRAEAQVRINEFKRRYEEKQEKKESLEYDKFQDPKWYVSKRQEYINEIVSIPTAPANTYQSIKDLTSKRFSSSAAKYPNYNSMIKDEELIRQVIRGAKPIAHVSKFRREIKLNLDETRNIAFVVAPEQMGGGTIWYKPYRRSNERPYDERILGLDPEKDKEERETKPYNPLSDDPNLAIVELYIWNNIANQSDPRLYNFINGLCLGYPIDYMIWFCESKYGEVDHRNPEKTFLGRMIERFKYCLSLGVNGYGRPGTVKPDGMFSKLFKYIIPKTINKTINKYLGTDESTIDRMTKKYGEVSGEYTPPKVPEKTEFESIFKDRDPFIESIHKSLDEL